MPLDNGVGFDDGECRLPFRPESGEQKQKPSIRSRESGLRGLSLKHVDLLSQRQNLQLSRGAGLELNAERRDESQQKFAH